MDKKNVHEDDSETDEKGEPGYKLEPDRFYVTGINIPMDDLEEPS